MFRNRFLTALGAIVAAAVLAAGVGTAVRAQAPQGDLRIVFPSMWNEALDPMLASSSGTIGLAAIYDDLIGTTPDGSSFSKERGLAEDWSMTPDGKQWTIRIRSGVQFHRNFGELTAEDVKFSIDRLTSERSVAQRKSYFKSRVGSVDVVDAHTVRITAAEDPIPDLLTNLSALSASVERFVVSKKAVEELGPDGFASNPVGTGPYRFAEHVGGQYIRLEAVPDHWRIEPRFSEVRFQAVPEEETSIAMLGRGAADVIPISRGNIARVEEGEGTDVVLQEGASALVVYFDDQFVETVPVHKAKVREALNLAIDRQAIVDALFEGRGRPLGTYYSQTRVLDVLGHDWKSDLYPYDPEKARSLLAEAGYPAGFDMDVYVYPWVGVPEGPQTMEAIAGMWDAIGIRTALHSAEYGVVRAMLLKGEIPGAAGYFQAPSRPWQAVIGIYHVFMHSEGSFSHVNHPELDAYLEQASDAVDEAMARDQLRKAIAYVREHHLAAPILEFDHAYGITAKAGHWDPGFLPQNLNYDSLLGY